MTVNTRIMRIFSLKVRQFWFFLFWWREIARGDSGSEIWCQLISNIGYRVTSRLISSIKSVTINLICFEKKSISLFLSRTVPPNRTNLTKALKYVFVSYPYVVIMGLYCQICMPHLFPCLNDDSFNCSIKCKHKWSQIC